MLAGERWNPKKHCLEECEVPAVAASSSAAGEMIRMMHEMLRELPAGIRPELKMDARSEAALFRFPPQLVQLLRRVDDNAFDDVVVSWSKRVEKATRTRWTKPFTAKVLLKLIELSRLVKPKGRQLFLWVSP